MILPAPRPGGSLVAQSTKNSSINQRPGIV